MIEQQFLALIRHGPTLWNAEKKIQGRTDTDLSDEGRRLVSTWHLPQRAHNWRRFTSPLKRTQQTASALRPAGKWEVAMALIETDWGEYEGCRLETLRESYGADFQKNEARGLDFRPPAGESPRDVQHRLSQWLEQQHEAQQSIVAVTHKGVIRAALALACGWDMTGKPPAKLQWEHAHIFAVLPEGRLEIEEVNVSLASPDPN